MVKILLAQINPIIGDFEGNLQKIFQAIQQFDDFDIAVFPELTITGYFPWDLLFNPEFIKEHNEVLERLKNYRKDKLIVVGGVDSSNGEKPYFNSAFLIHEGEIKAKYHKMCLPTYDVFDEKRYFSEGLESLVYEYMGKKIAVTICEDMWAAADAVTETRYRHHPFSDIEQPDIILNLTASPFVPGKLKRRQEIISKLAKKHQSFFFYSCQTGAQDGVLFDGRSMMIDPKGELKVLLPGFQESAQLIDLENVQTKIAEVSSIEKELEDALIMGIKDYFYKQGFNSCLIGLSGGIDSSLTLYLAVKALGASKVSAFMIPSLFTSDISIEDSSLLAKKLGVSIHSAPLGKVLTELEEMVKIQTSYQLKDITHQNMQARLRGLFLMAMSNQTNALVITTGNKSELAVGYATLYGDMCGSLAPLGDLYKEQVYTLAKFIQKRENIFPERVLVREPSAELCFGQKDQDTLPPYKVMDEVLQLYIEEGWSKEKIISEKKIDRHIVEWIIKKIGQTEYKRQQYAPILKVSKKTFGCGRKMPIVQKFF